MRHRQRASILGLIVAAGAPALAAEQCLDLQYTAFSQSTGGTGADLAAGDLDGDGNLDVLIADPGASRLRLLRNGGASGFTEIALPVGPAPAAVALGDVDQDGDLDVLVGLQGNLGTGGYVNDGLRLLRNDGHWTFSQGAVTPFPGGGEQPVEMFLADVNGDGDVDLDLLATSGSSQAMRLLRNNGAGQFALADSLPAGTQSYAVLLADTNGDGYDDPWSVDVLNALLTRGESHCVVERYGTGKLSSLGCTPEMDALGSTSIAGTGFTVLAKQELTSVPALVIAGTAPAALPMLGGELLVQSPWILIPTTTSAGTGTPGVCDGGVTIPVTAAQLANLGVGTSLYAQVFSIDPFHPDGTFASFTDGLRFESTP